MQVWKRTYLSHGSTDDGIQCFRVPDRSNTCQSTARHHMNKSQEAVGQIIALGNK